MKCVLKLYLTFDDGLESGEFCIFPTSLFATRCCALTLPPRSSPTAHKRERFREALVSSDV